MKNKEILILTNKQTDETIVYQLINNEYISYFDKNIEKIPIFDGFELLLTSQFDVSFTTKENIDWLINILNPNQYEKVVKNKTDIYYKKVKKTYMVHDVKTDNLHLEYGLFYLVFESKFEDKYLSLKCLSKVILLNVYNFKIKTIIIFG